MVVTICLRFSKALYVYLPTILIWNKSHRCSLRTTTAATARSTTTYSQLFERCDMIETLIELWFWLEPEARLVLSVWLIFAIVHITDIVTEVVID